MTTGERIQVLERAMNGARETRRAGKGVNRALTISFAFIKHIYRDISWVSVCALFLHTKFSRRQRQHGFGAIFHFGIHGVHRLTNCSVSFLLFHAVDVRLADLCVERTCEWETSEWVSERMFFWSHFNNNNKWSKWAFWSFVHKQHTHTRGIMCGGYNRVSNMWNKNYKRGTHTHSTCNLQKREKTNIRTKSV